MCTFSFFVNFRYNKYQINDKRACIILALGSIQEKYNTPWKHKLNTYKHT